MKKTKEVTDKSTPYRTVGATMIKAPVKQTNEPVGNMIKSYGDLRVKGRK